jgi:ribosomal protein L29
MKLKEKQNLKKTSISDLLKEVEGLENTLKKMKIERYSKEMKNSRGGRTIKKNIAIRLTYVKEQQLNAEQV